MCGDKKDHSLAALIEIVGNEDQPLSMTMRRMAFNRLKELERIGDMLCTMTGRVDWRRMTVEEWDALIKRPELETGAGT